MDKLHRSDADRMLGGVCGGLAETFGGSPWLYRVAFIIGTVVTQGVLAIVYLLLWAFLPKRSLLESGEAESRLWDRSGMRDRATGATEEMRQRVDQAREYVQRVQSKSEGNATGSKPVDRLQKQAYRVADDAVSAYQRWRNQQSGERPATDEVIETAPAAEPRTPVEPPIVPEPRATVEPTTPAEPTPPVEAPRPGPERQAEEPK